MRILIVDDEPMIREWFRMTAEKAGGEYRIVGEAATGEEAIAFCRANDVDLVVTDVKMPGMNGLELIKTLKAELPRIRSVVFSSYGEFQFAAEALKFGASEYILKAEITLQGLVEILAKVKRDIDLDRSKASELNALRYRLNENQLLLRSAYLREWLAGGPEAAASFRSRMEELPARLSEKQLCLLIVGILGGDQGGDLRIREDGLLKLAATNIMDETLQGEMGNGCSFPYEQGLFVLLVNPLRTGLKSQRESILLLANRVQEHMRRFVGAHTAVGISHVYGQLSYLPEQLEEALAAVDRPLFYEEPSIAWYGDTAAIPSGAGESAELEDFRRELAGGSTERTSASFERGMDALQTSRALSSKQARAVALESIYAAVRRARSAGVPQDELEEIYSAAHIDVQRHGTFRELRAWASGVIGRALERMEAARPKYGEAVSRACEYMALHYAEELSLGDVAAIVHLSRTYFSELFKKETGLNYNEYLMRLRLDKAKEMLESRTRSVAEVAAGVGYSSASYFIKVFRAYTGTSPQEYMRGNPSS